MFRSLAPAALFALVAAIALPAHAARFQFCWIGGNGYTMLGEIEFPDSLLNTGRITENDVTDFRIQGFRDGVPIGFWSLSMRTAVTSWTLSFDTTTLEFPMGGSRTLGTYQEWNANGRVNDCGAVDGFGFNGGNWAQDVCIDNTYIEDSSIDPLTPLQALPMNAEIECNPTLQIS